MDKIKKLDIQKIFVIFIIMQPIIDIITSILVRHVSNILTLGIFVRALFLIASVIYSLMIVDKKYKTKLIIYYGVFTVYVLGFILTMYKMNGTNMLFTQLKALIKCFYLPILLLTLYPIIKQGKVKINNKVFIYTLLGYTATIFITRILGIAYPTYSIGLNVGTTGLFYAANEIGIILGILVIFLFNNLILNKVDNTKDRILYIISVLLYIFAILEMGTKVPILAFVGVFASVTVMCIVKIFKEDKKLYFKKLIGMFILIIIIVLSIPYTAVGKNVQRNYGIKFFKVLDITFKDPSYELKSEDDEKKFNNKEEVTTAIVSGRNLFLQNNIKEYKQSSILNKVFGIGYVDKNEAGYFDRKTVEIDYCDIFILQGVMGAILFFIPIIIFMYQIIKKFLKNFKKHIFDQEIVCMCFALGLAAFVAMFAGHTLVAPSVSIYIAIIIIELNNYIKKEEKNIV